LPGAPESSVLSPLPSRDGERYNAREMPAYRNLVSDSILVQETIQMLRQRGGSAPAFEVADAVLQVPGLEAPVAALIISELIRDDWRMRLTPEHVVELLCEDDECRVLGETDYVVVDVETTGPKTPPCRIMEIGAYRVRRGRIVAEFQTLVNPQMEIPPFIAQLTGITDAMVRHSPLFSDIADGWLDFADTAVIVAHNALFDLRFINHEISRVFPGRKMFNPHLCTVSLSRRVVPDLPNHRLHTVADHFAVPVRNRHRAAGDARATAEVFIGMLSMLREHGVQVLSEARQFNRASNGERRRDESEGQRTEVRS
jgi:DNA polymerase III epsilon subunit family exonuclease